MSDFTPATPEEGPLRPEGSTPPEGAPPPESPPPALPPLPFEDPTVPWFTGFVRTVELLARRPSEAYARMSVGGSLFRPLVFGLVTGTIGQVISSLWALLIVSAVTRMIPEVEGFPGFFTPTLYLWMSFLSPALVVFALVINALLIHLVLMIGRAGPRGLGTTFRVLCYSYAAMLAYAFPICGSYVGLFWMLVLMVLGLSTAHGVSRLRVIVILGLSATVAMTCGLFAWMGIMSQVARLAP